MSYQILVAKKTHEHEKYFQYRCISGIVSGVIETISLHLSLANVNFEFHF